MNDRLASADPMRRRLGREAVPPAEFRAALAAVPAVDRDPWIDRVFNLDGLPADGPDLPRGCVPYLPSDVATLLTLIDRAAIGPDDVFVDVGAGIGRALALVHLATGAGAIGIEVQAGLAAEGRRLIGGLASDRIVLVEGDAAELAARFVLGTVFFLYCPFSGARLDRLLDDLAALAPTRPKQTLRVCALDTPLPARADLVPLWRDDRLTVARFG